MRLFIGFLSTLSFCFISFSVTAQKKDTTKAVIIPKRNVQLPKNVRITPAYPVKTLPAGGDRKPGKPAPAPERIVEGVIYVKGDATGANNGSSWSNAYTRLESALAAAVAGKTIWVARGVYRPGTSLDRTLKYVLKNRVSMYGHFAGTENSLAERNIKSVADSTFLDGNIGRADNFRDNSYTILFAKGLDNTTVIDGFVIQNAVSDQATQIKPGSAGAGLYIEGAGSGTNPVIRNCTFKNNRSTWGGALVFYCAGLRGMDNGGGNPRFENCNFIGNTGSNQGGAVYIDGYLFSFNPRFLNCVFKGNNSPNGGVVFHNVKGADSSPEFEGCLFANNVSGYGSSIQHTYGSTDARIPSGEASPRYIRCSFNNNQSTAFGQGDIFTTAYNRTYTITVSECRFEYIGTATTLVKFGRRGGAFYNASLMGGGIILNVNNSIFHQLQCGGDGGVIFNRAVGGTQITSTFNNCLFNENMGCKGGVLCASTDDNPASATLTTFNNSIFWYNYFQGAGTAGNCGRGQDIYLASPTNTAVMNNCLTNKADCTVMSDAGGHMTCTGMIFMADPLFTDAANRDFMPRSGSPLRDAGNDSFLTGITRDIEGSSRRRGAHVDIGPYEMP